MVLAYLKKQKNARNVESLSHLKTENLYALNAETLSIQMFASKNWNE